MSHPRLPYADRVEAGRVLAEAARPYRDRDDLLILGLPRGGVPVAYEMARLLKAPMDVLIVRKIGVPGQPELAMGAIATGGVRVLNQAVVVGTGVSQAAIEATVRAEQRELERRNRLYRGERPPPNLASRCVFLVDDGVATGSTMRAAVNAVKQQQPASVIIAVPVASREAITDLQPLVDEVICPAIPEWFVSVGQWYTQYEQTTDDEVRALLGQAWQSQTLRKAE